MSVELREIRRRISSIRQIHKVTSALQRISSARLTRFRKTIESSQKYTLRLRCILDEIIQTDPAVALHPFLTPRSGKTLLIVFGSERGLCGGYNTLIMDRLDTYLTEKKDQIAGLILVGKVIIRRATRLGMPILLALPQPSPTTRHSMIQKIADTTTEYYASPQGGPVACLFTEFRSLSRRVLSIESVLPLRTVKAEASFPPGPRQRLFSFEPNPEGVLASLAPELVRQSIDSAFLNSYGSEDAARQETMTRAAHNADDMLNDLRLTYSRIRQEIITREMIELSGGSVAVSSERSA